MVELTGNVGECLFGGALLKELQDLRSVRTRCMRLYNLAKKDSLKYFHLHLDKLPIAVGRVVDCIKKFYPDLRIPYHSRLRHFGEERIKWLENEWQHVDEMESTRRMIDLVTVSVLLDAGAGKFWSFTAMDGKPYTRSEGIAVATYEMFIQGRFSSDPSCKCRVDAVGLSNLTLNHLEEGFQIFGSNRMVGLLGRFQIIKRLGEVMSENCYCFGNENRRPGNLLDFVLSKTNGKNQVSVDHLWEGILALQPIFPERSAGVGRGDIWSHSSLNTDGEPGSDLIPFHKLSQWLAMSILEPIEMFGVEFTGLEIFTPLAEYRNGGLLVDTGVLSLRDMRLANCPNDPGSELIVEWRAMTVCLLDQLADMVREQFGKTKEELPLMRILEGGTWRAGRIIARELREKGDSPISILSTGTVF